MPGAAEFAQVEARISGMTDAELVEMVEQHPGDYEPWALELGRAELGQRSLSRKEVSRIEAENIASARIMAQPTAQEWVINEFLTPVLVLFGVVAFPFYFVLARAFERHRDTKMARKLRMVASMMIVGYSGAAIALLLWYFGIAH
jgi:hypothetical protein